MVDRVECHDEHILIRNLFTRHWFGHKTPHGSILRSYLQEELWVLEIYWL